MPGRTIPQPGFAGDDGRADPALTAALARDHDDPAFLPELLAALHGARVLAPVVALLGETEGTADGLVQDKTSDIAVPVLLDDVGDRALPVFTDAAALAAWDPQARPVPVDGPRAARVALAEGATALVLDVAGPATASLPGLELQALAEGRGRRPAWDDPVMAAAVRDLLDAEPAARSAHLEACAGSDARLTVVLAPDVDAAQARDVAARLASAVHDLAVVRAGVRGLEVVVTAG